MKKSVGAHTIVFPHPVFIVCTYDANGKPNAMAAAWGGICCSKPPCVAVSLRKATYSYSSIRSSGAFTVNIPSQAQIREADYFGMVSGRDADKFKASGLTAVKSDRVNAPFIAEFPLALECKLAHEFELGLHTQFVGEIVDIKADEEVLGENGLPAIEKVKPVIFASGGTSAYFGIGEKLGDAFSIGGSLRGK